MNSSGGWLARFLMNGAEIDSVRLRSLGHQFKRVIQPQFEFNLLGLSQVKRSILTLSLGHVEKHQPEICSLT